MDFPITDNMKKALEEATIKAIQEGSTYAITSGVTAAMQKQLTADGFYDRLAAAVSKALVPQEEVLIKEIAGNEAIAKASANIVQAIMTETMKKIEDKVKSYGWIKIGDKY